MTETRAQRAHRRQIARACKYLLHEGFVTLHYRDGEAVYTMVPEILASPAEDRDKIQSAIHAAGPDGLTAEEAAAATGLPLIVVRYWIGALDYGDTLLGGVEDRKPE